MDSNVTHNSQRDALAQRYGANHIPPIGPWNDVIASLLNHRSTRGFLPDTLPPNTLETLIAAAQSAATSSNLQTWSVMVVSDPALRKEFATIANNQKHIEECPLFMVWLADLSRLNRIGAELGNPFAITDYLETYMVALVDAALAAQNAVAAAESLGLANVYIGAMRNNPQRVAELLGLPPLVLGAFGLCIGYPKPAAKTEVKPRLPQSVIVHHDRYEVGNIAAQRADYDATLLEFSKRNEMAAGTWTDRLLGRAAKVAGMSGRHQMAGWLRSLGFPLK